ncbi:MAG: SIMPL domain-containing protein, partial [Cypionkella sp.]|nr:SIMPL domain-containing protein [Cypionkella sp.]
VLVAPDMATLSLGVTTNGATAAAAMRANSEAMALVSQRLKAAGLAPEDLQTSNLSLNPNWTNNASGASEVSGYVASNMLTVRVRDLAQLGGLLDAAISDGANALNGLSFDVAAPRPVQDQARKSAVEDARARALLLAQAAGAKLGAVTEIVEGQVYNAGPQMFRADSAKAGAVPVEAGQIGLTAAVTVTFALED